MVRSRPSAAGPGLISAVMWSNLLHGLLDVFHCVGGDKSMQRLVFTRQHLSILPAHLPLLHRTFAPDHDLGTTLLLNVLQCIATNKSKEERHENLTPPRLEIYYNSRTAETLPGKKKLISGAPQTSWTSENAMEK